MRIGEHAGNVRRGVPLLLAAVLGAAVVVFPAVASSEAPHIEAVNGEGIYKGHRWQPTTAEVGPGASVVFQNTTSTPHGVEWTGGPEVPSCSGIPISKGEANWKGTCTFTRAGVYTFRCYVHPTEMIGSVTVAATTTTTYTAPPNTGSTGGSPGAGGGSQPEAPLSSGGPTSLLAGSAVTLASSQRGRSVRGSLDVSQAGAGGRLEVDLLAKSASLASAAQASAGKLVLSGVHAGKVSFSVPLNARARAALRRRHRLALSARIRLQVPGTSPLQLTRRVLLRP
jgi:plastocyanin